jgi:hypothetical protein
MERSFVLKQILQVPGSQGDRLKIGRRICFAAPVALILFVTQPHARGMARSRHRDLCSPRKAT